jgi:hypothetical protein
MTWKRFKMPRRRAEVVALVLDGAECADTEAGRFTVTQQARPHMRAHAPLRPCPLALSLTPHAAARAASHARSSMLSNGDMH